MNSNFLVFEESESQVRSYCRRFPRMFQTARGSTLYDADGEEYIDFLSCAGAVNYGHNPPVLKRALTRYIEMDGIQASLDFYTTAKKEFIKAFCDLILTPRQLDYRLQFTGPTGTSVIESAVKLARKITGRKNIMAFTNGFHGMSGTSLGLTGNRYHRQEIQDSHITRMPFDGYFDASFDSIGYIRKVLSDNSSGIDIPAAVVVETIQGEGGVNVASREWLRELRALTIEYGILLIIDDIQAGCGRTGTFFSFEFADIRPDLICLSKSLSGYGLPLSLLLIAPDHDCWNPAEDNGTFRGNTLAFVSATSALHEFWSDSRLQQTISNSATTVKTVLQEIHDAYPQKIKAVRGRGLFFGIEFFDPKLAENVTSACFDERLIVERCGAEDQVIKIFPALNIDDKLLMRGLSVLQQAMQNCVADHNFLNPVVLDQCC